jgi:hypothetical protein
MTKPTCRARLARLSSFILHPSSFLFLLFAHAAWADSAPVMTVPASPEALRVTVPLPKDAHQFPAAQQHVWHWRLVEVDHPDVIVPAYSSCVAADGSVASAAQGLLAIIPPGKKSGNLRRFRLEAAGGGNGNSSQTRFELKPLGDKSLELLDGGKPVLVYNFGIVTRDWVPPKDNRRSRGCYVHPLYGLNGEVLTESAPKDHYHHHGIFWAWPHVSIAGHQYDLWTYKDIQQKFARWLSQETGPLSAAIGVENGWFVGDRKVMIERVWMRAYPVQGDHRALDFDMFWIPVDQPITLRGAEGKSYGGLNLRFAPRQETVITVPQGSPKEDLPDTPLSWADLTGKFAAAPGPSGAAIFVDPRDPDYPPTWLTRHYGILCVGWPGVKDRTFPAGKPIHLRYRIWIHKSAAPLDELREAYEAYTAATKAKWQ